MVYLVKGLAVVEIDDLNFLPIVEMFQDSVHMFQKLCEAAMRLPETVLVVCIHPGLFTSR